MTDIVVSEQWFQTLIDELKDIIVEGEFTARWTLVETYHAVGMRILKDEDNFTKGGYTQDGITKRVSALLNKGERTIEKAIQFARQCPDLSALPEGKNTSWHQICNKYLPSPQKEKGQSEEYVSCPKCGSEVMPIVTRCRCGQEFEITKENIKKRKGLDKHG